MMAHFQPKKKYLFQFVHDGNNGTELTEVQQICMPSQDADQTPGEMHESRSSSSLSSLPLSDSYNPNRCNEMTNNLRNFEAKHGEANCRTSANLPDSAPPLAHCMSSPPAGKNSRMKLNLSSDSLENYNGIEENMGMACKDRLRDPLMPSLTSFSTLSSQDVLISPLPSSASFSNMILEGPVNESLLLDGHQRPWDRSAAEICDRLEKRYLSRCNSRDMIDDSSLLFDSKDDAESGSLPDQYLSGSDEPPILHIKEEDIDDDYEPRLPHVTSSGRNKGSGRPIEPKHNCQVCGDVAAGFHCGAYVCEACKKFYLRCLKTGGGPAFLCPKNNDCEIMKETRSHCQRCRYQKCLRLSMYKPGRDDDKKLKIDFRSIACKVCNAPSSGFHFGAITCEGCKGFFRRMLKEQLHKKFICSNDEQCNIDSANRTTCKCCRFAKCLQVGMTLEGTRLGRQSNSVKRTVLMQCLPGQQNEKYLEERSKEDRYEDERYQDERYQDERDRNDSSLLDRICNKNLSRVEKSSKNLERLLGHDYRNGHEDDRTEASSNSYTRSITYQQQQQQVEQEDRAQRMTREFGSSRNHHRNQSSYKSIAEFKHGDLRSRANGREDLDGDLQNDDDGNFYHDQLEHLKSSDFNNKIPNTHPGRLHRKRQSNAWVENQVQKFVHRQQQQHEDSKSPRWRHQPETVNESHYASSNQVEFSSSDNIEAAAVANEKSSSRRFWEPSEPEPSDVRMSFRISSTSLSTEYNGSEQISRIGPQLSNPIETFERDKQDIDKRSSPKLEKIEIQDDLEHSQPAAEERLMYRNPEALFTYLNAAYKELNEFMIRPAEMNELMHCHVTMDTIWKLVEIPFTHHAKIALRFIKKIPGFRQCNVTDQIKMVQDSLYPLSLLYHCMSYNMDTGDFNWFVNTPKERDLILTIISPFASMGNHFRSLGYALKKMGVTDVDLSFLATMAVITASDGSDLQMPQTVVDLQEDLLDAYLIYHSSDLVMANARLGGLLARLAELKRAAIENRLIASQVYNMNPGITPSHLWKEAFLSEKV